MNTARLTVTVKRAEKQRLSMNLVASQPGQPVWYRYHETRYSDGVLMLLKSTYPVLKTTASGVWLDVDGQRRFVKTDARKRFACPTEQDALESYHARKRRQVKILRAQLAAAEAALLLQQDGQTIPSMLL